jgi:hypothetical protein
VSEPRPTVAPGVSWRWSDFAYGLVLALPASAAMASSVPRGLAFAVGVIPAAIVGVLPTRRAQLATLVVGALAGVSMFLGTLLAGVPVLAVPVLLLAVVAAALAAERLPFGMALLTLAVPLMGIGLSFDDLGTGAGLALVMVGGSAWAFVVACLWRPRPPAAPRPHPQVPSLLGYGIRLGVAAALAAAVGFTLDLDHVGWAVGACLLVSRPDLQLQRLRSEGRIVAVLVGAFGAGVLANVTEGAGWYALAAGLAVAGAAATRRSRWYLTPAFTTFLALSLLLWSDPADAESRFAERAGETVLGVGLAWLFVVLAPKFASHRTPRS